MNPIPSVPMLSGSGGSGKTLLVVGILAALVMMAAKKAPAPTNTASK